MTRLLVVGCGSIGSRHVRNLVEFPVDVLAHDVRRERAEEVASAHGVWTTTDLEEALERRPDCVLVCTPPHAHVEVAESAIRAGAHVFVEKPIAPTSEEARSVVRLAEANDRLTLVGCNMRFHPPVQRIQGWLDEGTIGDVEFVRLRYGNYLPNWRPGDYREYYSASAEEGGGIILDAIHELDLAAHWLGDVASVYCEAGKVSDLDIDVEDAAELLLRSTDGTMAEVHVDYLRPVRARTYELIGSDGMIRWAAEGKNPERSTVDLHVTGTGRSETETFECTLNEMYVGEMEHLLECLDGSATPEVDAGRGCGLVALTERAKRSVESGCAERVQ